jgi:MoaA/NifB/PqqE/SkfB family radical SAM enzyme
MTLVSNLDPVQLPNLRLKIQTNGVLMPSRWHRLERMQDRVESVTVTIDAARPDTYERLRRGAQWHQIVNAMSWLAKKKQTSGIKVHTRMIAQQSNYLEIEEFYNWSMSHNADIVEYSRILDWGTFNGRFFDHDVFDHRHPEYRNAMNELAKVNHFDNVYRFGGLQ